MTVMRIDLSSAKFQIFVFILHALISIYISRGKKIIAKKNAFYIYIRYGVVD